MLGEIGSLLLLFSLVVALYAIFAAWTGIKTRQKRWARSAQRAVPVVAILTGGALVALLTLFLGNNFTIRYVAQHSSTLIPFYLKSRRCGQGRRVPYCCGVSCKLFLLRSHLANPRKMHSILFPGQRCF